MLQSRHGILRLTRRVYTQVAAQNASSFAIQRQPLRLANLCSPPRISLKRYTTKHALTADEVEDKFLNDDIRATGTQPQTLESTQDAEQRLEALPPEEPTYASIPWYLKQQPSVSQDRGIVDIPDLPANSPPLLETILSYISITAGLDDLELLDLRHLDPPPALGPKLIMIIGTARSEKHLHVAADRFARWLRREHGLKANAAGLLGRNELKIKLRRKAKRMRMLANVGGAAPDENLDDGIRTGWICCTLSKIEAHPEDMHMPGVDGQEFVGFRDVKPGVNVVVQMFTEAKRAETDLETLWGGVLRTQKRLGDTSEERGNIHKGPDHDAVLQILPSSSDAQDSGRAGSEQRDLPQQFRRPKPTAGDVFPA